MHRKVSQPGQVHHASEKKPHSLPFLSTTAPRHPPGHSQQSLLDSSQMELRPTDLPLGQQPELVGSATSPPSLPCSFQRSKSLFSLPTGGPSPASSSVPRWFSNMDTPVQRAADGVILSIDDLEGAQETDVDTGLRLSASDLSVVSAYSAPSRFCNVRETAPLTSSYSNLLCQRRGSKEGLLPLGGGVPPDTSRADMSWFSKEPASSIVATSPTSGVSSPPLTSPEQSCQNPQIKRTGRDDTPPATLSRLGDNDNEEFYI